MKKSMVWWLAYDNYERSESFEFTSIDDMIDTLKAAQRESEAHGTEDNLVNDLNSLMEGKNWRPYTLSDHNLNEYPYASFDISYDDHGETFLNYQTKNGKMLRLIENLREENIFIGPEKGNMNELFKKEHYIKSITTSGLFRYHLSNESPFLILSTKYGLIRSDKYRIIAEHHLGKSQNLSNFENFLTISNYALNRLSKISEEILSMKFNESDDFELDDSLFPRGKIPNRALEEGIDWNIFQKELGNIFCNVLMDSALSKNNLTQAQISHLENLLSPLKR